MRGRGTFAPHYYIIYVIGVKGFTWKVKRRGSTYSEKLNYLLGIERYSRNLDYEKIEGACRDILAEAVPWRTARHTDWHIFI